MCGTYLNFETFSLQDPPRKRVDSYTFKNGFTYSQLTHGSPVTPRRQLYSPCPRRKEIDALTGSIRSVEREGERVKTAKQGCQTRLGKMGV